MHVDAVMYMFYTRLVQTHVSSEYVLSEQVTPASIDFVYCMAHMCKTTYICHAKHAMPI